MNLLLEAVEWLKDGQNWLGPSGILVRTGQHLLFVAAVVLISSLIALPIGLYIGHTGRWKNLVLTATGAARAVPTLGLLTLIGLWQAPLIALVALAMPPILAGAYSGVISAQGSSDAARAIGLTERQILTQLEIPAGAALIITGLRSAVLQVIATATLAAYTANLGLGRFLYVGLKTRDYGQMIGGALVVVAIALIVDLLIGRLQARASRRLGGGEVGVL